MLPYNAVLQNGILQGYNLLVLDFSKDRVSSIKKQDLLNKLVACLNANSYKIILLKMSKYNLADKNITKIIELIASFNFPLALETDFSNTELIAKVVPYFEQLIIKIEISAVDIFLKNLLEYNKLLLLLEIRNSALELNINNSIEWHEIPEFIRFLTSCQAKLPTNIYISSYSSSIEKLQENFSEIRFLIK